MIKHQRLLLSGVVIIAGILTLLAVPVLGRNGGLTEVNQRLAIRYLLGLYLPLFALIAAFHFSLTEGPGSRGSSGRVDARGDGRFLIALVLVTFWCLAPAILFAITRTVEVTLDYLTELKAFGDTVVLAALGFYFKNYGGR